LRGGKARQDEGRSEHGAALDHAMFPYASVLHERLDRMKSSTANCRNTRGNPP
jgi:hypothetical protein